MTSRSTSRRPIVLRDLLVEKYLRVEADEEPSANEILQRALEVAGLDRVYFSGRTPDDAAVTFLLAVDNAGGEAGYEAELNVLSDDEIALLTLAAMAGDLTSR